MKVCAVVPAFNEAEAIARVISNIKKFNVDAIVVNDGSTDETSILAQREKAHVINHPQRKGKGLSLRSGFDYALEKGYDLVFTIDADGQHDPHDIPRFREIMKKSGCPVITGNRMGRPRGMPIVRIFTNKFMSYVISALCRQHIPDTQCGYRLFTSAAIASIDIKSRKFEIESEILVKLRRAGFQICSIPVKAVYADEKSKIRPVRDTVRFIRFILNMLFEK